MAYALTILSGGSGSLLAFADEAYEIDATGHLAPLDIDAQPQAGESDGNQGEELATGLSVPLSGPAENEKAAPPLSTSDAPESSSSQDEGERKQKPKHSPGSPITDRQVYKTYAESMGLQHALVFLVAGIVFGVCLKLPGTYLSAPCR